MNKRYILINKDSYRNITLILGLEDIGLTKVTSLFSDTFVSVGADCLSSCLEVSLISPALSKLLSRLLMSTGGLAGAGSRGWLAAIVSAVLLTTLEVSIDVETGK